MVIVEKSFPRGGTAVKQQSSNDKTSKPKLTFGAFQKKVKKSKTKTKSNDAGESTDFTPVAVSAELLSYDTIQEGMQLMGMVKEINQLYLTISLPGRITARVSVLEISEAYSKVTKAFLKDPTKTENYKPLEELYKVGQIVYGSVQTIQQRVDGDGSGDASVRQRRRRPYINLTFKPANVHGELSHIGVKKGFIFNGAIEEIQEHGYIIESGIRGMRTFLPMTKCKRDHHVLGELVYLKVEQITQDTAASTCICKELKVDKLNLKKVVEPNIEYILPSTIVQFEVTKLLKNGLQGTLMNGTFIGYVNEHQLTQPLTLPEDFEVHQTLPARILYVMPLTKLVYLTLNVEATDDGVGDKDGSAVELKRGDVLDNAKVHHVGTGGVILVLKNKFKGIISFSSIKANYKGNYDQDELLLKYAKKSKHTVRILDYDPMDTLFICTDDKAIVGEKFFDLHDVKPGEFINATVVEHNAKIDGYTLQVGKFKGQIEKIFLAPSAKPLEANTKLRCRIISIDAERRVIYLTNRAEYMAKNCKVLTSLDDAKANAVYTGTIVNCGKKGSGFLLVRFFNDIKGVLHKAANLPIAIGGTFGTDGQQQQERFHVGQTMAFRIVQRSNDAQQQLVLALPEDSTFNIGEICPATIVNALDIGLEIKINYDVSGDGDNNDVAAAEPLEQNGLIPLRFLSDFIDLLHAKLRLYAMQTPSATTIEAASLVNNLFSIRDVPYFREHVTKDWNTVCVGDVMRAYVKSLKDDVVELWLPIRGYNKLVAVHLKMLLVNAYRSSAITLTPDQVIDVKVIGKEPVTRTLTVTAKLTDVWNGDLAGGTSIFVERYLSEVAEVRAAFKKAKKPIGKFAVGDKITATFQAVQDTGDWSYELSKAKIPVLVHTALASKEQLPKVGEQQECVILWIDYSNEVLHASNRASDLNHFNADMQLPTNLIGKSGVQAKVLLKLENVFICSLKKKINPLVYCPMRLHSNDFENSSSVSVREGEFCRLTFVHKTKPIAVLDETWKLWREAKLKRQAQLQLEALAKPKTTTKPPDTKKRKLAKETNESGEESEDEECGSKKAKQIKKEPKSKKTKESATTPPSRISNGETQMFFEDKRPDKRMHSALNARDDKDAAQKKKQQPKKEVIKKISGINEFWTADLKQGSAPNDSSEDDDDGSDDSSNGDANSKKKKKQTVVEKFKQQRDEEERLRAIEAKYADPQQLPESVDQFDRLVISEPNNSKNWINYMVYHLQSTEIEKARAVAQRAIKTISFRNADDLLNIWVALLNLELRYGDKKSWDETLKNALTYNDSLRVHLRVIEVLSDAGNRQQELQEFVEGCTKKFKSEPETWKTSAEALFRIGQVEKAQQLLHKALKCVPNREHVSLIVAFANINHKHGQQEMGQTLLDQIVTSYPKRVDVWTQYVDMLVKGNLIDAARNVLERAIIQKIPLKKMRTIFKKYLEFEERFGDEASVLKVKTSAMEYVKRNAQH